MDLDEDMSGHSKIDLGYALAIQKLMIALYPSSYETSLLIGGLHKLYEGAENPLSGQRPHVYLVPVDGEADKLAKMDDALDHFASIAEARGVMKSEARAKIDGSPPRRADE